MRRLSYLFCLMGVLWTLSAQEASLRNSYNQYGRLFMGCLDSAPFPHPERAQGHHYKDFYFSTEEHYSDNTVAIFIPDYFNPEGKLNLVFHFHAGSGLPGPRKLFDVIHARDTLGNHMFFGLVAGKEARQRNPCR